MLWYVLGSLLLLTLLIVVAGIILPLAAVVVMSRRRKASKERLSLIGVVASVEEPLTPEGTILVGGDVWRARTRTGESIERGRANVRVVAARGHLLEVERAHIDEGPRE